MGGPYTALLVHNEIHSQILAFPLDIWHFYKEWRGEIKSELYSTADPRMPCAGFRGVQRGSKRAGDLGLFLSDLATRGFLFGDLDPIFLLIGYPGQSDLATSASP